MTHMTELSPETKAWSKRASDGEKPFAKVYDHGTLVLSMVRDSGRNIAPSITSAGSVCWRAVDTFRSRRLKINAYAVKGRIRLDGQEPGVENGTLRAELRIPQPHPEADTFTDVDHSCRFNVDNEGYEEIETSCGTIKEALVSRFFAARPGVSPERQAYNTTNHERGVFVFDTQETPKNSKVTIIVVIVAVMVALISATWFLTS